MNGMHTLTAWWRQAPDGRGYGRRQTDAVTAAAGLGVVIVCGALVAGRVITATDVAVLHWINHWPGWLLRLGGILRLGERVRGPRRVDDHHPLIPDTLGSK
jgi:hypothetical protein